MRLVHQLRRQGIRTAVVSSSANCVSVLRAAGIDTLFDARVDAEVAGRLRLAGKPAPDTYLKAAELLGVSPARAVVVEDALSGVRAGRNGGFGLVVGVARRGERAALQEAGADVVVADVGGNVQDGAHIASMGGTWMAVVYGLAGMRDHGGDLSFDPRLAEGID